MKTFESEYVVINKVIVSFSGSWQLKADPSMDFDDVAQILRMHVHKKWFLWDQTKKLEPWLKQTCRNQIKNLLRNNYYAFSRPCLRCPHNLGLSGVSTDPNIPNVDSGCAITKDSTQCSECPLYAKWEKLKKGKFDVKMPVPLNSFNESGAEKNNPQEEDVELSLSNFHDSLRPQLKEKEFKAYEAIFLSKDCSQKKIIAKIQKIYNCSSIGAKIKYKELRVKILDIAKTILKKGI